MDFMAGFGSTNQGHCHPEIIKALIDQAPKLTQTSRSFNNRPMAEFAEYITDLLGYDKILPASGGAETCEAAIKLARRWGYESKGVLDNQAHVIVARNNFWGRTITAAGACDDPTRYTKFGPFTPGFTLANYNDVSSIEQQRNPNTVAVMLEPI